MTGLVLVLIAVALAAAEWVTRPACRGHHAPQRLHRSLRRAPGRHEKAVAA